jgi:hypothetical protein
MMSSLRLIVVVLLAAFATGTYAQTAQGTAMDLQMSSAIQTSTTMSNMSAPAVCDHCKTAVRHTMSCDFFCAAVALETSTISLDRIDATSAPFEIQSAWGYDGTLRSPVPPPPRITILG